MSSSLTFLTLLQDGPVPLAVVSGKGIITLVSQSFERATGLTAGDGAPMWLNGTGQVNLGDKQYALWVRPFLEGSLVVLRDRTDARHAEERIWEHRLHLARIYSELEVRERLLDRTLARLGKGDGLSRSLAEQVQEDDRQRQVAALMRRHVAPEVADSLAARTHPELDTHKTVLTVLFADMPAIDDLMSDMESEEFVDFLNEFQSSMTRIIYECGGTIDRIVSVGIKAFFGDPVPHDDHAVRAVRAALHMKAHLGEMRPRWFPAAHDVDLHVGIHTGYATVGMVGPEQCTDYTAVGRNVALARSILQEAEPGQILLSGRTYDGVREEFYTESAQVTLRGSQRPMTVYKAMGERTPAPGPALQPDPILSRTKRLGPYLVLEKIGEGGMAAVYKGLDEGLNRNVALKVLSARQAQDQKFVARFQREAQGLAKLNSPYVAQIYYIGAEANPPFFAMEFVEGRTLREVIQKDGAIPVRRSLAYLSQMARGLQAAAESGIIHRDIKPDNVMINSKGQAKLMDFGLVKRADDESGVTQHGIILGTPRYMSPEQARCEEVDLRSDIYSLGATFFHMVVGKAPFDADSALGIMRKHEIASLPPLDSLPKSISPAVYELVSRMMAKKREDRFQDYASILEAIDQC